MVSKKMLESSTRSAGRAKVSEAAGHQRGSLSEEQGVVEGEGKAWSMGGRKALRGQPRSCLQRKAASLHSSSGTLTTFFLSDRSGSAGRTKAAILELIQPYFDSVLNTASTSRRVLEVASGLGEHLKVRLSSPSLALLGEQLANELIALLVLCRGQP